MRSVGVQWHAALEIAHWRAARTATVGALRRPNSCCCFRWKLRSLIGYQHGLGESMASSEACAIRCTVSSGCLRLVHCDTDLDWRNRKRGVISLASVTGNSRMGGMSTRPNDTSASSWHARIGILARMDPASRVRVAIDLSNSVRELQSKEFSSETQRGAEPMPSRR
jgi:hypothetical protein